MAKKKPDIELYSYGRYENWNRESKDIPRLLEITDTVPAILDTEFGMIIKIKKAKGVKMSWMIDHPGVKDDYGVVRPPFEGEDHINGNSWDFFLGDMVWEPIEDKIGPWRLVCRIDNKIIAEKTIWVEDVSNP